MKLRTESFTDGIANISIPGQEDSFPLPFTEKVVGYKRYFTARSSDTRIDRLIVVPVQPEVQNCLLTGQPLNVRIGDNEYTVEQGQYIKDTIPDCLQLSLRSKE